MIVMINKNIVKHLEKLSKTDPSWSALNNALSYFQNIHNPHYDAHLKRRIDAIGDHIVATKNPNKKAIDVGSNFGAITFVLAEKGYRTIAVDTYKRIFDEILIPIAQYKKIDKKIDYHVGYGEDLPYDDNYFDIATCGEVIEHIEKLDCFLDEINRILKIDGTLIISTPNGNHTIQKYLNKHGYMNPEHVKEYDFIELKNILSAKGFELQDCQFINHDIFPILNNINGYFRFYNLFISRPLKSICKVNTSFDEIFSLNMILKCKKTQSLSKLYGM